VVHSRDTSSHAAITDAVVDHGPDHLFRFGIIADIQYAEAEDALNFDRTKYRRYRHSLDIFRNAIRYWKEEKPVDFTLALGDIVDAKAASKNIQSDCLQMVLDEYRKLGKSLYLCFGNHCQHCFSRDFLRSILVPNDVLHQPQFHLESVGGIAGSKHLFYHWSPFPGWRFISVDSYDLSIIAPSSPNHGELSEELITANNPNDLNNGSAWFVDQPYDKIRWAPYNGGIGKYQLLQLEKVLEYCNANNERAIFFAHQPVYSPLKPKSLIWNSEEVLRLLWKFGDRVVAWFAGHDHDGEY
jgi:manganese-dependent ADP-ribose/CDP-alcohol diphosphatase